MLAGTIFGQTGPAKTEPAPSAPKEKTYVGSETCQMCHEEITKPFQKNAHHLIHPDAKRGWKAEGCESCHGPGSVHAESASAADIINPAKLPAAQLDQRCLGCHLNKPTHVGRIYGPHAKNSVSCISCHSIHAPAPKLAELRTDKCVTCHSMQWSEFQRPYGHRLQSDTTTGSMTCVDCHNPHGTLKGRSLQMVSANEPGCFKCHGDKRGPFTFEHAPVRLEGCAACHETHGSANPHMLTRQEVRFVCLECHSNAPTAPTTALKPALGGVPPAFHDLRSPRYRNCTVCHLKVHGSYVNRTFLR